ncbi:MAG: sensor histidine kinase [Pontibacterium sp.]
MHNLDAANTRIKELELQVANLQHELDHEKKTESDHARRLASRMRQLLDLLPAGVIQIGADGFISDCNPAAEELLGSPLTGELWLTVIQRSFAPRNDDGHEVSLKDGRRVNLATRAMDGEPGQLVLLTNLTETRLLQERLSHYQRLSEMGRMMASLAHQIRTPLSAALLYADHLSRNDISLEQRIRFTAKVKSRLTHLEKQVRDMLVFARAETRLDDHLTTQQLLSDLEDQLDVPLAAFDADCDCINEAQGLQVQCNKDTLLGALMNLVDNALQASGKSCELQLRLFADANMLRIEVTDQGPGMDQVTCQRAMEPFYTTKSHGTGLGLAVAQVVAMAHHGSFELSSQPGQGTTASLILPLQAQG